MVGLESQGRVTTFTNGSRYNQRQIMNKSSLAFGNLSHGKEEVWGSSSKLGGSSQWMYVVSTRNPYLHLFTSHGKAIYKGNNPI